MNREEIVLKVIEDNGPDYKFDDIRTYKDVPIYKTPSIDIEWRLAIQKEGGSVVRTPYGNVCCASYEETGKKAESLVLHYPKPTEIGMVFVKSFVGITLYPPYLIARYNIDDFSIKNKINVYYSPKEEAFFGFFDEDFMTDNVLSMLNRDVQTKLSVIKNKNTNKEYLCYRANDIETIRKFFSFSNKDFNTILENYQNSKIDFSKADKVIVIRYEVTDSYNDNSFKSFDRSKIIDIIKSQRLNFSFFKALKVKNHFFVLDENDNIDTEKVISVSKSLFTFGKKEAKESIVFNEYTDQDWKILNEIFNRYKELNDSIYNLFNSCENGNDTFKQISEVDISSIKLIGSDK